MKKIAKAYTVDIEKHDFIDIWFMSDMHLGHENFSEDKYLEYIDWVKEKDNRYILGVGDYLECVTSNRSPGNSLNSQNITLNGQIESFVQTLKPVKDRIIALTTGNHEQRIEDDNDLDLMGQSICPRLDTHYLGYQGWVRIRFDNVYYLIYMHHGRSNRSQDPSYELDKVVSNLGVASQADIVAMGHIHQIFHRLYKMPSARGSIIYDHTCHGIRTGGFLQWPSYAQDFMNPPPIIGSPIVRLRGDNKRVGFFWNLDEYNNLIREAKIDAKSGNDNERRRNKTDE